MFWVRETLTWHIFEESINVFTNKVRTRCQAEIMVIEETIVREDDYPDGLLCLMCMNKKGEAQ